MTQKLRYLSVVGPSLGTVAVLLALSFSQVAEAYEPYRYDAPRPCPVGQFIGNVFRPITNLFRPHPTVVAPTVVYENRYPYSGRPENGYCPHGNCGMNRPAPWGDNRPLPPPPSYQTNYPEQRFGGDPFARPNYGYPRY